MANKIKVVLLTLIAASLLMFVCAGATVITYADTDKPLHTEEVGDGITEPLPDPDTQPDAPEPDGGGQVAAPSIEELAERFKTYLIGKYGEDYEYYYNQIIEQWGSIEGYLLAFGEKLPEEQRTGWDKFVGWLSEYAPVWATAFAVAVLITAVLIGKSKLNKLKSWFKALVEKLVNKRLAPIEKELNLQSGATVSMLHAQKALLGTADKFSGNVKELDEAEKWLSGE